MASCQSISVGHMLAMSPARIPSRSSSNTIARSLNPCGFFFLWYAAHRDLHKRSHSFPTRRSSDLNSRVLAWLTGGESLHNNHHAHARSPKFGLRRSELDPSWLAIRLLAAVRLVAIVGAPLRARATREAADGA